MTTDDLAEVKKQILDAALIHVAFDGWTETCLQNAAREAGFDATMGQRAFPGGAVDLIAFFIAEADRQMLTELESRQIADLPVRERIATAVRVRLQQNQIHREAIRRAMAILALPQNGPLAMRTLYHTVDAIWHAAGDRSTDFNFYSKRALLGAIYSATVLYWLNDNSEDQSNTWQFLDRRIADVMRFEKAKGRLRRLKSRLPDPLYILRRRHDTA